MVKLVKHQGGYSMFKDDEPEHVHYSSALGPTEKEMLNELSVRTGKKKYVILRELVTAAYLEKPVTPPLPELAREIFKLFNDAEQEFAEMRKLERRDD